MDSLPNDIIGSKNKIFQEILLQDENWNLDTVIKNCKMAELTSKHAKAIQQSKPSKDDSTVFAVHNTFGTSSKTDSHSSSSYSKGKSNTSGYTNKR